MLNPYSLPLRVRPFLAPVFPSAQLISPSLVSLFPRTPPYRSPHAAEICIHSLHLFATGLANSIHRVRVSAAVKVLILWEKILLPQFLLPWWSYVVFLIKRIKRNHRNMVRWKGKTLSTWTRSSARAGSWSGPSSAAPPQSPSGPTWRLEPRSQPHLSGFVSVLALKFLFCVISASPQ